MRTVVLFNHDWLYLPEVAGDDTPDSVFEAVTLPHSNKLLPHHNFDSADYAFISTYRKRFTLPEPLRGRRAYLDFDGVMLAATVTLNGHPFPEHRGGFTPFSVDITDYVVEDRDNCLTVQVDSTERPDIPPYGNVVDYMTFGGIYRDVRLRLVEPVHISSVFVKTSGILTGAIRLSVEVRITNLGSAPAALSLYGLFADDDYSPELDVTLAAGTEQTYHLDFGPFYEDIELWSLERPALYELMIDLLDHDQSVDSQTLRFGFREAEFRQDGGFYLNGERVKFMGLNRHQNYPYIGPAAPPRLQRLDADIIRFELGCNIVRTSHYPQSPHFLDRCDEIGLLVLEEIPGWQHIGDEDWQSLVVRDVRAMIERDRNHPSIILWGVRVNESADNESFYTQTNALAHQLDPTRPTGGVRNRYESQFLEDVFTFNDFRDDLREPNHTPYMITEFGGHMFPAKIWDHEERLVEHALRHARIHDQQFAVEKIAGAIGWCAFDYNTHQQFGSGDRICYHGVMDIFRLPKYAAYVYASQIPPEKRIVLFAATVWALGDRNASRIDRLVVFSNCATVEVFVGEQCIGQFEPDRAGFPHLIHPPYQIPMATGNLSWGQRFPDLRVVGYLNGQKVAEHRVDAESLPAALILQPDHSALQADGADMTRVIFKIVDRFGNRLPYTNQPVFFETEGPADLIGENPFALIGGQAAVFVRARREVGTFTIRASTPRLAAVTATIQIVRS